MEVHFVQLRLKSLLIYPFSNIAGMVDAQSKPAFQEERESEHISKYANEKAKQTRWGVGKLVYKDETDNSNFKKEQFTVMENGAKYFGQWDSRPDEREGRGIQVWNNGSMYEDHEKDDFASLAKRINQENGYVNFGNWLDDKTN